MQGPTRQQFLAHAAEPELLQLGGEVVLQHGGGGVGFKQGTKQLLGKLQPRSGRMQIHKHQPAARFQQPQGTAQHPFPIAAGEFVQGHAQLDGAEAGIGQGRIFGQPFHPLQAGVALGGQIQGPGGDIEPRHGVSRRQPGGRCFATAAAEIQHRRAGLEMGLHRLEPEAPQALHPANTQRRHRRDRVVNPAVAVGQRPQK